MADHRIDIYEALESYTQSLRDVFESGDEDRHWTDDVLEVEVFKSVSFPDRSIVEFLLAYGGPTVRVTVHPRNGVEFFHSWGMNPTDESNKTTLFAHGEDAEFWQMLADEVVELGV